MSQESFDHDREQMERAVNRVKIPAILLFIVGVINVLATGFLILKPAIQNISLTKQQRQAMARAEWNTFSDDGKQQLTKFGVNEQKWVESARIGDQFGLGWGIAGFLGGFLTVYGGWGMIQMRSWSLALLGSILCCIPVVSCLGCCGIGQIVGIWSIVALVNAETQDLFRFTAGEKLPPMTDSQGPPDFS